MPPFERIVAEHGPLVSRIAMTYEADPALREDLTQQIFLAVWQALPSYRADASLKTFIARIAQNRAISFVTDQPISGAEPEYLGSDTPPAAHDARRPMRTRWVAGAAVLGLVGAAAGGWAAAQLLGGGDGPASAVPAIAVGYVALDLDPTAAQKAQQALAYKLLVSWEHRVSTTADAVIVTFTDNGCGMTPEVMEHLFEPFFTRRRGGQGTGLGLNIVRRYLDLLQGDIAFESEYGKGSTFTVSIPNH